MSVFCGAFEVLASMDHCSGKVRLKEEDVEVWVAGVGPGPFIKLRGWPVGPKRECRS